MNNTKGNKMAPLFKFYIHSRFAYFSAAPRPIPALIMNSNIFAMARQCYVCGIGSDAVFKLNDPATRTTDYDDDSDRDLSFGRRSSGGGGVATTATSHSGAMLKYERHHPPPSCLDFDQNESLHEFVRECPDGYRGCLTQIDGKPLVLFTNMLPGAGRREERKRG